MKVVTLLNDDKLIENQLNKLTYKFKILGSTEIIDVNIKTICSVIKNIQIITSDKNEYYILISNTLAKNSIIVGKKISENITTNDIEYLNCNNSGNQSISSKTFNYKIKVHFMLGNDNIDYFKDNNDQHYILVA